MSAVEVISPPLTTVAGGPLHLRARAGRDGIGDEARLATIVVIGHANRVAKSGMIKP